VNGCAEGLGEQEHPRVETIAGMEVHWTKLTHADAGSAGILPASRNLPTYRLIPKDVGPNLKGKQYFFWTSGSSFERALELNPWMKSMTHFCGPGNTQRTLQCHGIEPHIFLDHEQWLKEVCQPRER
jgi:hydroxymethylbilane synthase